MKIAIIGAGYGGMAAAYDLRKAGHAVTIFESAEYVGGLASGFKEPHWDWSVEKFYHHWFQTDSEMLGLTRELGLEDKVRFPRPFTVMLYKNKWYPFDSILKALLFPGLGFGLDKIRFGFVGLFLRLTDNWRALEKVTADEWMMKWAGKKVYEQMWKPLLIGKFGPYYKDVNMAWMWSRIKARSRPASNSWRTCSRRNSGGRGSRFGGGRESSPLNGNKPGCRSEARRVSSRSIRCWSPRPRT